MAGENTVATLDAMFHEIHEDGESGIVNVVPQVVKLQRLITLDEDLNPGDYYKQMIELSAEHGVTYADPDEDVVLLNAAEASESKEARVKPAQIFERAVLGYNAADKAQSSKQAFRSATENLVMNMLRTMRKRTELDLLYGQKPIATVSGLAGQVISIDPTSWAPGAWYGSRNASIDVFQSNDSTVRQAALKITAVDMAAKTITVSGTTTGIVAGDLIYFKGQNVAGAKKSCVGLDRIATATTGVIHNIDASVYVEWRPQSYAINGNLSMLHLLNMVDLAGVAGCELDVVALIPHKAYTKLNADQAALREYDGSYTETVAKNGVKSIKFVGQTGTIDIVPHTYVKESECFIFAPNNFKRIGREIGFTRPGQGGSPYIFRELQDNTGYELRCWTKQVLYTPNPAWVVKGTGINYV